jgi:Exonuclease
MRLHPHGTEECCPPDPLHRSLLVTAFSNPKFLAAVPPSTFATGIDWESLPTGTMEIPNRAKNSEIEIEKLPKTLKWRATSPGGMMLKNIALERPLAVIDLETTGIDTKIDRIIEVSVLKLLPGGGHDHRTRRVNPGVPIPAEATQVHGITDDDVADCPTFRAIAPGLARFLEGCDLAGFNILKYDLRLLAAEYNRAGVGFSIAGRKVIDACHIFHQRERRDLTAAYRFYCGLDHQGGPRRGGRRAGDPGDPRRPGFTL